MPEYEIERDDDGKPIDPGPNADVAHKHAYNLAMEEWKEEHGDGEDPPSSPATEDGT